MKSDNPLNIIFVKQSNGKLSDEITDIKNISNFFKYLKDDKINSDSKIKVLDEFKNKIKTNRFISEFFSEYESKSIYIHLFDLFIKKSSTDKLKSSIRSLIEELCLNIQTSKEVYEYIFQNLSKIYRKEIKPNAENIYTFLELLSSVLCETDNIINPKNYFSCCGGNSYFEVDFKERAIDIEYSFTININFKVAKNYICKDKEINLIQLFFSNKQQFNIDLKLPFDLIIKDLKKEPIKKIKENEWNNLIVTIANINNSLNLFVNLNGENENTKLKITNLSINFDDKINNIKFFNNFIGEVSSIYMFTQMDPGASNIITPHFLSELKNYKEGLWKKKLINNFFKFLRTIPSVDFKSKTVYFKSTKLDKKEEKKLYDNLIFVFTPINYYKSNPNIVEDVFNNYQLKLIGNIRNHLYQNYQKKLSYVCEFSNFFPIAEMFLIYPETLNEQNFDIFLKIISNMLNYRKHNLKNIKKYKFFNILSMFIEKYPQKIFTQKILNSFFQLGKTLFISNLEVKCSNYFKHILLNEKILSKYDSNLQIQFWDQLFLFHESDKQQVQTFLKINRLCLILRYYDRNKYTEMCCEEHLNMIKDEYKGSKKVMNPSMSQKLKDLEKLIKSIIVSEQISNNAIDLFKLLTLDLSPCLVKFILNIFIEAFKDSKNEEWSEIFVLQLSQIKFGVIIINTFTHSLPDVRIELLKFMYQVHKRLFSTANTSKFIIFEKMLKTCLLPDQKFSTKNINKKPGMHIANPPKNDQNNKEEPKNNSNTNQNNNANQNNNNNNNQVPKAKSNFAALLSKFETKNKPAPSNNNYNYNKKNTVCIKPQELQKKIEKNENPLKTVKTISNNNIINNNNKVEEKKIKEVKEIKEEKPNTNVNKINEDIKSKINKFNENKTQDKKPALKPIKEEKENNINEIETKARTFTVFNKNAFENNPFLKKNIIEKANNFKETKALFEKKNTISNNNVIPKNTNNNSNVKKNVNEKETNKNINDNINKNISEKKPITNKNTEKVINADNKDKNKIITQKNDVSIGSNINKVSNSQNIQKNISNKASQNNISNQNKLNNKDLQNKLKNIIPQNIQDNNAAKNSKSIDINNNIFSKNDTIIKDDEINDYIKKLYSMFMLWATENDIDSDLNLVNFDNTRIKFTNILELILLLLKTIKDNNYIINFFKIITILIINPENSYELFFNKKIYASFLDITFGYYKKTSKEEKECFKLGKNILITLYINSFIFCEQQQNVNPGNEVETLFLWGDNFLEENVSKEKSDLLHEFFYELFFEFLLQFKLQFEEDINFDPGRKEFDIKNYILKNYLMFITSIYNFVFKYELEKEIHYKGLPSTDNKTQKIEIPKMIITSMRMKNDKNNINEISQEWLDFPLIYDIFNRYKFIWVKNNVYKNLDVDKYKTEKASKYNLIIEKLIFNKEKKNSFQSELLLLCYEDKTADFENVIPLIKIIPYTIMCILEKIKSSKNERDFLMWVKDLKDFIRFVIIASSNLIKQIESYKQIQESCFDIIASGIFFMKNLYDTSQIGKSKIMKSIISLFLLCFKLIKWNYNYHSKHSGVIKKIISRKGTNDIVGSSIIRLFSEYCPDANGNILLTQNKIDSLCLDDNSKCISEITKFIESKEFINAFWENQILKNKLLTGFFSLNSFKKTVDLRYDLLPCLQETLDESYKKTILELLPQYETELAKYSNNSLEKNIRNKNKYKAFKKIAFSWRGYWSCRENFFCENPKFKYKLINHYTKNFMKPILVPILDISYYLPEFTGFDPKNLFRKEVNENKINLDIDKVLKLSENNLEEENNKDKNKNNKNHNYLLNIYKKSNLTLYEKYKKIANNLEFGKEEEFSYIERDSNKSKENKTKKYFLSCLVKTSHHIKGVCFIDDNNLNFKVFLNQKTGSAMSGVEIGFTTQDDDYDQDRQTCFGSYFVCHPKDKDLYKISINYNDIKWIFRRKYYYTNSAFEIFTTSNKTYYFNFKFENDRETVINEILKKIQTIHIVDDLKEGGNKTIGYENKIVQKKPKEKIKLSEIIKKWKNWEIDNFQLLMWFNIFGNRSYNDISQYPIFPWVLSKYIDPLKEKTENSDDYDYQYRDMNLPLGMMELSESGIKRKETYLETFNTLKEEPNEGVKPYIYGTSYSNPYYVCYYLIRLFPFSHISIELQGKKFDNANRLFFSVANTFKNSTTQKTDVKELIPEFFYLPEMFLNINDLNLGTLDNGNIINEALTPCNNNPYDFIMTMRSVLESNKLSYSLQNWVDLVFGFKSRGKEAENAFNVYTEASYQEQVDITKVENKEAQLRLVEFGLIPNQIMNKECNKRDKKENILKGKEITDSTSDLKYYLCKPHNDNNYKNLTVVKIGCYSSDKLLVLYNNNTLVEKKINVSPFDKTKSFEDSNTIDFFKFSNKMSQFYNPQRSNNKIIQFCQKGKLIILGGFYDGKVQLIPLSSKFEPIVLAPFQDKLPILSIAVDKEEEFAFFGNSIGNVCIIKLDKDPSNTIFYQTITHQMSAISHIDCNSDLNLWASGSIDGYINLYTLPLSKLLRIIKVPTNNLEYVFLSESPLPTIIAITEEKNISEIFVYSLNGKLLLRQKEEDVIKCPLLIRDMNTNNYLAYILNDTVVIRSLPNLIREVCIEGIENIYSICPSEDMKTMYGINKNGKEIYVIKEEKKSEKNN